MHTVVHLAAEVCGGDDDDTLQVAATLRYPVHIFKRVFPTIAHDLRLLQSLSLVCLTPRLFHFFSVYLADKYVF